MKKATHRCIENTTVKFKIQKDFLGNIEYKVVFRDGETTTLSKSRFEELFKEC